MCYLVVMLIFVIAAASAVGFGVLYRVGFDASWSDSLRASALITVLLLSTLGFFAGLFGLHKRIWPEPSDPGSGLPGQRRVNDNRGRCKKGINYLLAHMHARRWTNPIPIVLAAVAILTVITGVLVPSASSASMPDVAAHFVGPGDTIPVSAITGEIKPFVVPYKNQGKDHFESIGWNETVLCLIDHKGSQTGGSAENWSPISMTENPGDPVCRNSSDFLIKPVLRLQGDSGVETGEEANFYGTFVIPDEFDTATLPRFLRFYFQPVWGDRLSDKYKKIISSRGATSLAYIELKVDPPKARRALEKLTRSDRSGQVSVPGIPPAEWKDLPPIDLPAEIFVSGLKPKLGKTFEFKVPARGVYRAIVSDGAWSPGAIGKDDAQQYTASRVLIENWTKGERFTLGEIGDKSWSWYMSKEEATHIAQTQDILTAMFLEEGDLLRFWLYSPEEASEPEGKLSIRWQQLLWAQTPPVFLPLIQP